MKLITRATILVFLISVFLSPGNRAGAQELDFFGFPSGADFHSFLQEVRFLEPPKTIRVRITGDWPCNMDAPYTVATMDFNTYVKNVLPNEWHYWWPEESLKAGAVAVKMFAWYWIERGGKWPDADMTDNTCDQWFRYGSSHPRTDRAVDETWSWVLSRDGALIETRHKNIQNCRQPTCMKQSESAGLASEGYRWDEILAHFYPESSLWTLLDHPAGFNLRFNDGGSGLFNRVMVPLDSPSGLPWVNTGAADFTLEWYMKAYREENQDQPLTCGDSNQWMHGSVIFDRDRPSDRSQKFGISLSEGRILFGATGPDGDTYTLCGTIPVGDGQWHHIALQRRADNGKVWLFVDGVLDAQGDGPAGDISFPEGGEAGPYFEDYLFIGGSRKDGDVGFQSYRGWLDEIRFSEGLRYPVAGFTSPEAKLPADDLTAALFRLDEGKGVEIWDSKWQGIVERSGEIQSTYPSGIEWQVSDLFITYDHILYLPLLQK
jgi:hypothetical protein